MKKVGIIGGAGFIGSHITRVFLNHGFEAKVSVTDISRQDKYKHLTELENSGNLYITELNVENKNQLQQFVQDCDMVIHGGTPFQLEVSDPKSELFDPTIRGTENFLEAISNTPSVEKVVIIASVAANSSRMESIAVWRSSWAAINLSRVILPFRYSSYKSSLLFCAR